MVLSVEALLLAAVVTLNCCDAANILCIFPTASFSHQQPLLAIGRALAARGHNLTVINTNPNKTPLENYRDIDLGFLYKEWDELKKQHGFSLQERISPFQIVSDFQTFLHFFSQKVLSSPQIQDLIREVNGTKFDLVFFESIGYSSLLGFSELVGNPPMVGMLTLQSFTTHDLYVGNPEIPSYIPSVFMPYEHRMTFYERMRNFANNVYFHYMRIRYIEPTQEEFLKRYFGDVKHTAYELERNISLMLISADLATSYPKPVHPNTIYIGPTHIEKPKPLPQDLQKWMDESEDGVIYFSLGSNMKGTSVPAEKRAAFIKAFSQFPQFRVLWKWEADTQLPDQPSNVLVKKWLPQQSILAHPKTRLFISQVGLQSFQEATSYGVPILGIPMFGDQDFNAAKLVQAGAGRVLEFHNIAYDNVYENLKELLTNKSYKDNMMTLSKITNDKPMPAVETAVWWIEYVLRHNGAPHLRPASIDLTWYQYYSVDDLQKWMDESEDGVIYFSLGSNMKGTSVPAEKRAAFIKAFSQFPQFRVLWKWEADTQLPDQPSNVLVKKWLPQQSILAHPKTRLFISQVGLQSFQEATSYGVPILGIPMFGDQDFNAAKLVQAGAGRVLEFHNIAYDNVYENLKELLTNKSYKDNMMTLSKITNDKPMPAVETAVWWIEYVLRHNGAPHLRPASIDLTWYQYYSVDVIAFTLAVIVAAICVAAYALKIIITKLTHSKLKTH